MKVLLISTYEYFGGASIAAKRLLCALIKMRINSKLLIKQIISEESDVLSLNTSMFRSGLNYYRFLWERIVIFMNNGFNRANLFKVSLANTGIDISKENIVISSDIIHIHWINQGFLSLNDVKKILDLKKPVVWTLHDMWPITSICHHSWGCEGFTRNCGKCPFLQSKNPKDLSYRTWKKKKFIASSNIQIVAVSSWLAKMAKKSSLTRDLNITVIPNVIDLSVFYQRDKRMIRKELSMPEDVCVVLMGAARLDDPIKGFGYLKDALSKISTKNVMLLLFGAIKDKSILDCLPVPHLWLGVLSNSEKIAELYSAADVTVVPSYYETFGQTIIEAMACGCPAVSFNNSGQTDIIDHKINGYLAQYRNVIDFAEGIDWVLSNRDNKDISLSCIKKVRENYAEEIVASKYISLYRKMLDA